MNGTRFGVLPTKIQLITGAFLIATVLRVSVIAITPNLNKHIDLCIYVSSGQLVSRGINPYRYEHGTGIRRDLRATSCNSWIAETQTRWNYYASSNLPLSLLMYGAIEKGFPSNPIAFRLVFAVMDGLLGALIVGFVFEMWKLSFTPANCLLALGLAAISPTLLWWGAVIPEDKGIQILLMVAALFAARRSSLVLAGVFLGASIAFKGLGIFIAPLCLWWIIKNNSANATPFFRRATQAALLFLVVTGSVTLLCFAPFFPEILDMMRYRLANNLLAVQPIHGSIWRPSYLIFHDWWLLLKNLFVMCYLFSLMGLLIKRTLSPEILTAGLLVLFVDVLLLAGSMDRMNIGIVVSILLVGLSDLRSGVRLGWFYVAGGAIVALATIVILKARVPIDTNVLDAIFVFAFVLYFMGLLWQVRGTGTAGVVKIDHGSMAQT